MKHRDMCNSEDRIIARFQDLERARDLHTEYYMSDNPKCKIDAVKAESAGYFDGISHGLGLKKAYELHARACPK